MLQGSSLPPGSFAARSFVRWKGGHGLGHVGSLETYLARKNMWKMMIKSCLTLFSREILMINRWIEMDLDVFEPERRVAAKPVGLPI